MKKKYNKDIKREIFFELFVESGFGSGSDRYQPGSEISGLIIKKL